MIDQRCGVSEHCDESFSKPALGRHVVAVVGTVVAVLGVGLAPVAAPPGANADIGDLFQPIIDAVGQVATGPAGAGDNWLFSAAGTVPTGDSVALPIPPHSIPLEMRGDTQPVVSLSIDGGGPITALADTGSESLTVPWYYLGFQSFPWPTSFGVNGYEAGLSYLYATVAAPVDFGAGLTTAPTDIHAVLLAWPTSLQNIFELKYWSLEGVLASADAQAILGLGPNAADGVGVLPVTTALPGDLAQGVLISQQGGYLQFGPNPLDPLSSVAVTGAPISTVQVSIDNGPLHTVQATIDTGGVYGTMPASVLSPGSLPTHLPSGTLVSVYTGDAHPSLLYSYVTTETNTPDIDPAEGARMNTGNIPFALQPVYVSNSPSGVGMTIFGNPG